MSIPAHDPTAPGSVADDGAGPRVLAAFCAAVNTLKRTALSPATLGGSLYLGGDLGIDSMEMLEIWFELEQRLQIKISDAEKRDIYTVDQVVGVVAPKL